MAQIKSGKTIKFRLVNPSFSDAEFIYNLRINPKFNTHLSIVSGDVKNQVEWLEAYKKREQAGTEYYFIIERKTPELPIGVVRVYDFAGDRESFSWGSWILNDDKTNSSAIESALIIYDFGFRVLGFRSCHFDVRKGNEKVISFHEKCGAFRVGEDEQNIYYNITPETYITFSQNYAKYLEVHND